MQLVGSAGAGACSRGWTKRCANAKSPAEKCRCKCGGAHHGVNHRAEEKDSSNRHARFSMVRSDEHEIVIRDEGPWGQHLTVTNDAEWVVGQLGESLRGRRLFYFDSSNELDEIVTRDGRFVGFAPGPQRAGDGTVSATL